MSHRTESTREPARADAPEDPAIKAPDDHAVFEYSLDGVIIGIPDGRILAANPAAQAILGADEAEIHRLGRQGISLASDGRWAQLLQQRRMTGSVHGTAWMVRAYRTPFLAEMTSSIYRDAGREERSVVIFRDVTNRVRLEQCFRAGAEITRALLAGEPHADVLAGINRFALEVVGA